MGENAGKFASVSRSNILRSSHLCMPVYIASALVGVAKFYGDQHKESAVAHLCSRWREKTARAPVFFGGGEGEGGSSQASRNLDCAASDHRAPSLTDIDGSWDSRCPAIAPTATEVSSL